MRFVRKLGMAAEIQLRRDVDDVQQRSHDFSVILEKGIETGRPSYVHYKEAVIDRLNIRFRGLV